MKDKLPIAEREVPVMKDFEHLLETDKELYAKIEHEIIWWSNDGTKTAGALTRILMCIINPDLCKKD